MQLGVSVVTQVSVSALSTFYLGRISCGRQHHVNPQLHIVTIAKPVSTLSPYPGGAFDTVPELCILLSLFEASAKHYPVVFDEAGL